MSDFSLTHLGGGTFELSGRLDLANVGSALSVGRNQFIRHDTVTVDLDHADCASTASVALLLEWSTWSDAVGKRLSYRNAAAGLIDLVELHGVDQLLRMSPK